MRLNVYRSITPQRPQKRKAKVLAVASAKGMPRMYRSERSNHLLLSSFLDNGASETLLFRELAEQCQSSSKNSATDSVLGIAEEIVEGSSSPFSSSLGSAGVENVLAKGILNSDKVDVIC